LRSVQPLMNTKPSSAITSFNSFQELEMSSVESNSVSANSSSVRVIVNSKTISTPFMDSVILVTLTIPSGKPSCVSIKDSKSTLLVNRDLLARFKVSVNPKRKFVLSNWLDAEDETDIVT